MKKYRKCSFRKYKKEKGKEHWRKIGILCVLFAVLLFASPEVSAFASNITQTTAGQTGGTSTAEPNWLEFQPILIMRYLASFLLAYVSFKGAIQLGNNISELSAALKNQDDASKQNAINGIFGGAIQFFISGLLAIFGIAI